MTSLSCGETFDLGRAHAVWSLIQSKVSALVIDARVSVETITGVRSAPVVTSALVGHFSLLIDMF